MKTDKLFNATYSCLIGISLLFLGIITLIGRKWLYVNIVNILLLALFILSLKHFLNYFFGRKKDKNINFTRSLLSLIFCLVLMLFRNIPLSILPLIFGLYLLLNSIIKFINAIIFLNSKSNGKLTELFLGIVYLVVAVPIIFSPIKNIDTVLVILGVYILLLGINYMIDFISFIIPIKIKDKLRRRIRITLPSIIEAIIPYTVLNEINYLLDKDSYDDFVFEEKQDDLEPDVEVFVHISNRGFNRMGHVDICYNNMVISYGGYDDESLKFFTMIGDGVIYTVEKEKYIPFCIEHSKKTIFAFGLKLTSKQKENISKTIDKLFKDVTKWEPPYQRDYSKDKTISKSDYDDFASRLYQATKAKFYKINRGKFKKFFVLGSNCSKLADYIIGKSGIDILKMNGVITPGAYYEYLNREFKKKNSIVISRKIYNNKNVDQKIIQKIFKGFSK